MLFNEFPIVLARIDLDFLISTERINNHMKIEIIYSSAQLICVGAAKMSVAINEYSPSMHFVGEIHHSLRLQRQLPLIRFVANNSGKTLYHIRYCGTSLSSAMKQTTHAHVGSIEFIWISHNKVVWELFLDPVTWNVYPVPAVMLSYPHAQVHGGSDYDHRMTITSIKKGNKYPII